MNGPNQTESPASELPVTSLSKSLAKRVLLLTLIGGVGLASAIAVGLWATLHQVQARVARTGVEAVHTFDRFFLDIQSDLRASSEGLASRRDKDFALLALQTRNRALMDVFLLGANGQLLARRSAAGRANPAKIEPQFARQSPPFGKVMIGPVRFEGETPYVDVAVMVTDDISLPAGSLVVRVDLTGLWNATLDIKVGETGYAYIADSSGQLVACRNRRLLKSGSNLEKLTGHSPQAIAASRLSFYTGLNGAYDLASAEALETVPWFAIVEQPAREALAPFLWPAFILLAALISVAALLYSTIRFTQDRIVSPLLALRDAVSQIADGLISDAQLRQTVEIPNNDELGHLSQSFNRMAGHLRQAFVDLQSQFAASQRVSEALRVNEVKQGAMIANIADVIAIVDQNGINRFKSPNIAKWFGWTAEELVGRSAWDNIHPDDVALVQFGLGSILPAPGSAHSGEVRYRCKDGSYKWIQLSAKNLLHDPHIAGILLNYHDITERRLAETSRRESENQLRKLLELVPIPLAYVNKDGVVTFRNQRFIQVFGYTAEDVPTIAEWWPRAYPDPQYRHWAIQTWDAVVRRAAAEGRDIEPIEYKVTCKSGKVINVEISGMIAGEEILATFTDLTERKRAEESHARLATVVEQASETIVITDIQGTIVYVNPMFEKTSGYTSAEAIGSNPGILKSSRHDAEFYRQMWEVLLRGEVWQGHFINRRKDGTLYEEDATISPVQDAAGKVVNYLAIKRDVTREVLLETQLRQSQKLEAVGQLAGGVAHDFNNILTSLFMQTDLTEMVEDLPVKAQEGLRQIRTDAQRAAELTRQLLLFSRQQVMQTRMLDLNKVVTNLGKMLQRTIGEHVQLQLRTRAIPLTIRADAGMIDQILVNLAVNARDAMPEGGRLLIETSEVTVDAELRRLNPDATADHYACLSVSDTGTGIPPEVVPRIFEPFFTTKEEGKGTGLGLATVFGIVKQHQGWIRLENHPGQGATFHVYIPLIPVAAEKPAGAEPKAKARGGTETILLVEDELAVLGLTSKVLEKHGYTVLKAVNGREALNVWEENCGSPSLLLTDLRMPGGLGGLELARQLQAQKPGLKVIFASGYSADIAGKEFQLRKGEVFITKPFSIDFLLETVRQCLDG